MFTVYVTDYLGRKHKVYAVKPQSSNPADAHLLTVIHDNHSVGTPFVVHRFNLQDGGFYLGRYCESFADALSAFNAA